MRSCGHGPHQRVLQHTAIDQRGHRLPVPQRRDSADREPGLLLNPPAGSLLDRRRAQGTLMILTSDPPARDDFPLAAVAGVADGGHASKPRRSLP